MSPLSGVLGEAWTYYKRYAAHFLLIAFVIYVAAGIIAALLGLAGSVGLFLGWIVSVVAAFLVQAALVKAVQDVRDGQVNLNLGETVSAVLPFLGTVIIASILAGIGIAIGLALIIVPGLILLTFWSLIVPSIVIGGEGVFSSFRKSWRTVRGYAWHVFGTYVLVFLILIVFDIVIGLILLFLPVVARNAISSIVSGTLVAPFLALVVTLIYYRLTVAHEARGGPGEAPRTAGRARCHVWGAGCPARRSGRHVPGSGHHGPGARCPADRPGRDVSAAGRAARGIRAGLGRAGRAASGTRARLGRAGRPARVIRPPSVTPAALARPDAGRASAAARGRGRGPAAAGPGSGGSMSKIESGGQAKHGGCSCMATLMSPIGTGEPWPGAVRYRPGGKLD